MTSVLKTLKILRNFIDFTFKNLLILCIIKKIFISSKKSQNKIRNYNFYKYTHKYLYNFFTEKKVWF